MSNMIFAENAEKYWENGLDIVPGKTGTKQPSISNWQGYLTNQPSQSTRAEWQKKYANHGLCLLTGGEILPGYQLIGLDIDDDSLVPFCKSTLGKHPCSKRGKKDLQFLP